jgi:tetratricopeptide (TPR) repeat protein
MLKIRKSQNAYDTLGLPRSATATQVRARYRQLVRGYKRELAPRDLLKHEQFRDWTNAYLLLLSPERKEYDRRLRSTGGREQPANLLAGLSEGRRLLIEAEAAFLQRKFNEAVELGKAAVKLESRNGEAYALLGDILREQGKYGNALTMYNYAVQFDPNNRRFWQRLEESTALRDGKALPKRYRSELRAPFRRPLWAWVVIGLALAAVEITMLLLRNKWGPVGFLSLPVPVSFVYAALASGFLLGLVLAATALIGPFDDEMLWYQVAGFGTETTPIGIFIVLPALVFFWAAPAFYVLVAFLDEHFSLSVAICLAVCAAVALGFSATVPMESRRWVQMLGGNVVFFGFTWGWLIGGIRRRVFDH